ncbi:late competence development ComFB family protein [Clostridium aestuarii]|uniref:Late competence development ComFB family protein n=1 Tax=Clostridium aestuarii TaxID=338193 RepID=A0ABT4CWQ4_9CLOT|nr:late competence development ComFB family protein [Clostridium aestuarii]MCY6483391.1 late competence development ComFB family protein [Clostridium aestuarii]
MYSLKNYSEEIVDHLLNKILKEYNNICKCDKCKLDIKAYALNSIKPKYIVTEQGEIYTRALHEINKQEVINITNAIMQAIEVVSNNPKH